LRTLQGLHYRHPLGLIRRRCHSWNWLLGQRSCRYLLLSHDRCLLLLSRDRCLLLGCQQCSLDLVCSLLHIRLLLGWGVAVVLGLLRCCLNLRGSLLLSQRLGVCGG